LKFFALDRVRLHRKVSGQLNPEKCLANIPYTVYINRLVVCSQEGFLEKLIRQAYYLIDFMIFMLVLKARWLRHRLFLLRRR